MKNSACICILIVTMLSLMTSAQRRAAASGDAAGLSRRAELQRGATQQEASGNLIQAAESDLHAEEVLLTKQNKKQARLDRRAAKQERRRARKAKNEAQRLKAAKAIDYETYENDAEFHNLDAAADLSKANKFGLSIISENRHDEKAAIRENSGAKTNSGTRLAAHEAIDTEAVFQEVAEEDAAYSNDEALSAADANEDLLDAQQRLNKQQQSQLNAQNLHQQTGFIQNFGQSGQAAGFNSGFQDIFGGGGGLFGKRR